jgi:hypothetical protein
LAICSLDNESDFWNKASNLRELISDTHAPLGKTALGRIYELIYFKKQPEAKQIRSGRVTPNVLCKGCNDSIKVAVSAEPVSERVCDMAVTIYDRALSLPGVKEVLKDQDELRHNSVFSSVNKMQAIIEKARLPELINWSFSLIAAFSLAGILGNDNEAVSLRAMQGRTRNCHGFGTINII